ncbi:MAG: DUF1990 family protein [Protaetiibacter sp.]
MRTCRSHGVKITNADDSVVLRIRAFSRPATWLFRVAYPAVLLMQELYTRRYLRALRAV